MCVYIFPVRKKMLLLLLIKFLALNHLVKCNYSTSISCRENQKFSSKIGQFPFMDYGFNLNIEFVDICYYLRSNYRTNNQYYLLENSIPTDDRLINFLKITLTHFGFTIDNVLGKGNYGVVFAARSQFYGNVAIKIAANTDGAFYDFNTRQECCYYPVNNCNRCTKSINQLIPFEGANAILTIDALGVVKSKAFGIISSYTKFFFYIIVMEKIENSMTLLSFTQKCFKRFNKDIRSKYIQEAQIKLNEINKKLIKNQQIFHNDLKSDNILVKLKNKYPNSNNLCGNGKDELEFYLIDFGNSILNVNQLDQFGNSLLAFDQFKNKKYYIYYRAPDVLCERSYARMPQILAWYLGVIAFEMCSNGFENFKLSPDHHICFALKMNLSPISNSFDRIIRISQQTRSLKMCFEPYISSYLQMALNFNPNTRVSNDDLMKTTLIQANWNKQTINRHTV